MIMIMIIITIRKSHTVYNMRSNNYSSVCRRYRKEQLDERMLAAVANQDRERPLSSSPGSRETSVLQRNENGGKRKMAYHHC